MKISVIIPSYKPHSYLWTCLDSLYNQTFQKNDYEIILILNGCKEPYDSQIKEYIYKHKDLRVKYIQTDMGGVSNARNIGLDNAQGEYIAFVDDDDFVSPYYLEELFSHSSPDVVALCYPLSFIDGTSDYLPYHITEDYIKNKNNSPCSFHKARRFFSGPVYKLIHKDVIKDKRFNSSFKNGEDSLFMFEISDALKKVDFTNQKAVYYRRMRRESALYRRKKFREVINNSINIFLAYSKIYLRHPFHYSFTFYSTRVLGVIHSTIEQYQIQRDISTT